MAATADSYAVLTGEQVRLRPFAAADVDAVHAYAGDPQVSRFTTWGPNDLAATQQFVEGAVADRTPGSYLWALTLSASGELVGGADLHVTDIANRRAMFGYVVNRAWWGRGLATEAAGLLRDLALGPLGVHRLEATCRPDNLASRRVIEKTGLVLEGRLRDHVLVRGEWRDSLLFALVGSEESSTEHVA